MDKKTWEEILDYFENSIDDLPNYFGQVVYEISEYYSYNDIAYCEYCDRYTFECFMNHKYIDICEECLENI